MSKHMIEISYETLDDLTVKNLKNAYEQLVKDWHNRVDVYDDRDDHWQLLVGMERVLEYFMVHDEYESYMSTFPPHSKDVE